jgi:hypothetical protein
MSLGLRISLQGLRERGYLENVSEVQYQQQRSGHLSCGGPYIVLCVECQGVKHCSFGQ